MVGKLGRVTSFGGFRGKDGQGRVSRLSVAGLNNFSGLLDIGVFLSCMVPGLEGD